MIAKAAGVVIGVGLISTGGIAMTKPHWLGMDYMPTFHSLSEDNGFSTTTYDTGKFANKLTKYLVGVKHKGEQTKETNQSWWEWAYRRLQANNPGTNSKFGSVDKPYHNTDAKALNKVCEEAYKKNESDFSSASSNTQFTKDEVWKYCSPGKPTTTSRDTGENVYGNDKIGGDATNKTTLVSVKDSSNDWFWKIRNEEFWSTKANDNNLSGETATGEDPNKSLFKNEYETNKEQNRKDERRTIKDLCEEAYGQNTNSQNSNNDKDAKKFCVLEVSAS